MKQLFTPFKVISTIVLMALAAGCTTTNTSTTDLLTAAGFKLLTADTPKKQELLATLPKDQLSLVKYRGKTFYVQPAAAPNQAYVGTSTEYQSYQQLRLAKQLSNENLMNGLEVQASLRENSPETRIIFISGRDDPSARQSALDAGALGFLAKPFEDEALVQLIRKAVAA